MPAAPVIFTVSDVRGGVNNSDSPTLLEPNQVVDARNVDFRDGALGSKRRGTQGIDITGAAFDSPIIALIRHTPTSRLSNDELWGIDENGNVDRRVGGTWQGSVARVNDHVVINQRNFEANGVSLHGKLFIAAQGTEDRLLVWDGSVLRWAGFNQTPDPSVADSGAAGSYSGTRYFRTRYIAQHPTTGVILRRSEPSNTITFVPSGAATGAVITKAAGTEVVTSLYCEGQTHWEVEASVDNILWYRIATVAIGTATYTDLQAFSAGYTSFTLSEQIGEYIPPRSARHLAVDEDRVVMAGAYFEDAFDSQVTWTPVAGDDGKGNDERVPTATLQYINFDGLDGGGVTMLVAGVAGNVYVFKNSRVYKMVRTGVLAAAYENIAESFARGATPRGACAGSDRNGVPCVYFLDPNVGLCRIGRTGVEDLAQSIRETWRRRNPDAAITPRLVYYPGLDQLWYTSPTDGTDGILTSDAALILTADGDEIRPSQTAPNLLVIFETRYDSSMFHDGVPGTAQALGLFPTESEGVVPVLGTALTSIEGGGTSYLHFGDSGTTDSGASFRAYVKTKPYMLGDLWSKFGLMAAALMARASVGVTLALRMIRNFGVEERVVTVSLTPALTEAYVIKPIDNASMSELNTVQLEYGDAVANTSEWSIDRMVFRIRAEEGTAG